MLERGNGPWRQLQKALGRLALGLLDENATLRIDGQTALDLECGHLRFESEILFHESEDLAAAHARRECEDIGQRSVSDWMHGKTACPREVPTYADAILGFSAEEWNEFALAYAYGQTVPKDAFEDLVEFREFHRAKLVEESKKKSRTRKG